MKKTAREAGADQRTPSIPQYFSWINNTNEGSTEKQTLINLDFFGWLKRTYGMEIKIYAWDAGNFDGIRDEYGDVLSEKFKSQYPNGFEPIAKRAAELGIRLGIWGGPDGFGDTPESEKKRYDFMVDLCKKYNFALLKIDGVCGDLRPEKAGVFAKMLEDCRKYCPDFVVLNHRLELYEAEKKVTTSLWQGAETYVDVHSANTESCMHHRGFIFDRGLPDDLDRLLEDHGVCISSAVAYFEDDLIYQAFGRSFILAPEIYGNPWFMRDDEFPRLARVYNLHRAVAPILVDGIALPKSYGHTAVSRGEKDHRFVTTGNNSWKTREITIKLNEEIGIERTDEKLALISRHPYEKLIGIYGYGDEVKVDLLPFRAHLFEIAALKKALPVVENCEYEVICEDEKGIPKEIRMLYCEGAEVTLLNGGLRSSFGNYEKCDLREFAPVFLGSLKETAMPQNIEKLFEAAMFAPDNDSLERRELKRAGETKIPEVKAARDAFFNQKSYLARGCDSSALFDNNPETFFDGCSRSCLDRKERGQRIEGGCLRVDFGEIYNADEIEITCFAGYEGLPQLYPEKGSVSTDFADWRDTEPADVTVIKTGALSPVATQHYSYIKGDMVKVCYKTAKTPLRYFRLPCPMDRIYSVRLLDNGKEITLKSPTANNLMPPYYAKKPVLVKEAEITLPTVHNGDYISVAINGEHGNEGAYCVLELDGNLKGFPERGPAYTTNVWEFCVEHHDKNYTYYLPLTEDMSGKRVKIITMLCDKDKTEVNAEVWLCPNH